MMGWLGNRDRKVFAVFASSSHDASIAIVHLKRGEVQLPIFLFCQEAPPPGIAEECARVIVDSSPLRLLSASRSQLSGRWVALGVTAWTGRKNPFLLKVAPFLFPPFRVLIMNVNEDFFPGHPGPILGHFFHLMVVGLRTGVNFAGDMLGLFHSFLYETAKKVDLPGPYEVIAQFSSPLSRFVFAQFRGSQPLIVSARACRSDDAVLVEIPHGEWRRRFIVPAVESSGARWVVFIETARGESLPPLDQVSPLWEDLLVLFDDPRTFAVSRQTHFRGWLKAVLPANAFRILQPDEASQVFAPLGKFIVFDREKLVALGIPNLRSAPANFCLLFWKAAAAGWRSFAAGSPETVRQMASMPQAEAQFVQALLHSSAVAMLRPAEPFLNRGTIARRTTGGLPFRSLPRVLVLSPYLPFPLSHGGAVRIYNLCRALSGDFDFVLACFREKDDSTDYSRLHEIFREVYVVSIDEVHKNPSWPDQVSGYESSSMRALIGQLCSEKRIDLLQIEYTQLAGYREAAPHVPAILVEHDITFSLYAQFAQRDKTPAAERKYQTWLKFEKDRLLAFDAIWTMSEADRDLAAGAGAPADRLAVIPNGVDIEKYRGGSEDEATQEILYVGSFRHSPNYIAFQHLRNDIMPMVWKVLPGATLVVVAGPNHEKYWTGPKENDSRVTIHGFVSDLAPLYKSCNLTVAPLEVSAGTNIKVMEALATERAIVTTPAGCQGLGLIDGFDAQIRTLGPDFAEGMIQLLRNPAVRREMARQGRLTAERRFSWTSIKEQAAESYEKLLAPPQASESPALIGAGNSLQSSPSR